MRPLWAILVVAGILGGLQAYMVMRPRPAPATIYVPETAAGQFSIELTLTFDAGPDAFALDLATAPAVLIQFQGEDLLRRTDAVAAGEPIVVPSVSGIVAGGNEFFVQVTPQDSEELRSRAVRVRVLRDGAPIGDATLWSPAGEFVEGVVVVDVPAWSADDRRDGTGSEVTRDG